MVGITTAAKTRLRRVGGSGANRRLALCPPSERGEITASEAAASLGLSERRRNDKYWSLEEELAGRREPTQVGRALADMGVETRYALSAQAKGRVERLWGVLQDRRQAPKASAIGGPRTKTAWRTHQRRREQKQNDETEDEGGHFYGADEG